MVAPPVRNTSRNFRQLRAHDRRRHVGQPQIIKRQLVLPLFNGFSGDIVFLPSVLIGTGHDGGARNQVRIISNQNAALTGIEELVGLKRKAPDLS